MQNLTLIGVPGVSFLNSTSLRKLTFGAALLLLAATAPAARAEGQAATSELPAALAEIGIDGAGVLAEHEAAQIRGQAAFKTVGTVFEFFSVSKTKGGGKLKLSGSGGGQEVKFLATKRGVHFDTKGKVVVAPWADVKGVITGSSKKHSVAFVFLSDRQHVHVISKPGKLGIDIR